MEEILKKLGKLDLLDALNAKLEEIKNWNKEMAQAQENLQSEFKSYKHKMEAETAELRKHIRGLENKIQMLEETEEAREKKERKMNIIITERLAQEIGKDEHAVKNRIQEILKDDIGIEADVQQAHYITKNRAGLTVMKAKLGSFTEKIKIMKNKKNLKGREIYIDDDLTRSEVEIQREIREYAKHLKLEGNIVKTGYKKIRVNDKWENWEEYKKKQTEIRKDKNKEIGNSERECSITSKKKKTKKQKKSERDESSLQHNQ